MEFILMDMIWFRCLLLVVVWASHCPVSVLCGQFKTLDVDNLLLLNVAVKGRLVNKLTDAIEETQTARQALTEKVKGCLVKASANHVLCRECVRNFCEKRTLQCNGNITKVEIVMKREEETPLPEVKIVEPDVKLAESVIEISNTATEDILLEVPDTLQEEGHYIVEEAETESKLETLGRTMREGFNMAMDNIPKLMPKVKEAFSQMDIHLSDPESIDRLANDAAHQVAIAMQGKEEAENELNRNFGIIQENLPQIVHKVNNHLNNIMSSVQSFMKSTVNRISQLPGNEGFENVFKFPKNEKKWSTSIVSLHVMKPNGQVTSWSNRQNQIRSPDVALNHNQALHSTQFNRNSINPHASPIPAPDQQVLQTAQPTSPFQTRGKRSFSDVQCDDIAKNPQEACEIFHFRCQQCANDTILLQHGCGKTALKTMVDIKMLDMKTALYVTVYRKYLRRGLVVEKVKYDESSYDAVNEIYRSAFVTAKIGKKIITYETSALPSFTDLTSSGGEIGEELWEIMNNEEEFEPGHFVKSFENELEEAFHLKQTSNSGCVQSTVNSVVFTVTGLIVYFGFIAL
ncbi:uncharacterized protein LOC125665723 isoform X2 [Ostrea edulis]|uniref:uncharacterized protein LOC125665723 isoform X2 n=1 Tax=Ostrea edulis TaxID=37623 RepID=UPI002094AFFE|nr:uncharacterized protein LOC125665723 isoform X2 [Ostrea edulis]